MVATFASKLNKRDHFKMPECDEINLLAAAATVSADAGRAFMINTLLTPAGVVFRGRTVTERHRRSADAP